MVTFKFTAAETVLIQPTTRRKKSLRMRWVKLKPITAFSLCEIPLGITCNKRFFAEMKSPSTLILTRGGRKRKHVRHFFFPFKIEHEASET